MNKLLFVGGSQRSGTSLLQLLLSQDDETNPMTREVSYLSHLMASYHASKIDPTNALAYFNDLDELKSFHARIVEKFLEVVHKRFPDAKYLVLKEPHLTLYFPDLHELISDVKFVVVLRDPFKACTSINLYLDFSGSRYFWLNIRYC